MLSYNYYQIMKGFLNGYFVEIHGRGVMKSLNFSQRTVSRILVNLENEGILSSRIVGNLKYYSLNFLNPLILNYLVLFESFREVEFFEKYSKLIDFSREIEGEIVCVFGSYANFKNKKGSDLDLYVVGKVDSLKVKNFGEAFGFEVQVFNISLNDFRKAIRNKNKLFQEVLGNHILIKGKELFVQEVLKWSK